MARFVAGFLDLAEQLGSEIVGDPVTDECNIGWYDDDVPVGRSQITSSGFMVWTSGSPALFFKSYSDHGVVPAPLLPEPWSPTIIKAWSPNHGGARSRTHGCVIHSTRGGASSPQNEFNGTINWFKNPASQVSAHIVIGWDGRIAECVDDALVAWHAGENNSTMLGVEVCQSRLGDEITHSQYQSLAWWLKRMSAKYGFALNASTLPEHKDTLQGQRMGKSDIGQPYSFLVLKQYL